MDRADRSIYRYCYPDSTWSDQLHGAVAEPSKGLSQQHGLGNQARGSRSSWDCNGLKKRGIPIGCPSLLRALTAFIGNLLRAGHNDAWHFRVKRVWHFCYLESSCKITACNVWRRLVIGTAIIVVYYFTDRMIVNSENGIGKILALLHGT